jgi:hypothetical protein
MNKYTHFHPESLRDYILNYTLTHDAPLQSVSAFSSPLLTLNPQLLPSDSVSALSLNP